MHFDRWKISSLASVLILSGFLGACSGSGSDDDDEDSTQSPIIGAFNAVSDLESVTLFTFDNDDEYGWGTLGFGGSVSSGVSKGELGIRAEVILPTDDTTACAGDADEDGVKDDDECTEIASTSFNVQNDTDYMAILYGQYGDLEFLQYSKPLHVFDTEDEDEDGDPEDENLEIWFFHLAKDLGQVDVYLEAPGTNLSPVQVKGTVSPKDAFDGLVDEGEYVLTLTEVGNPQEVLFISNTFTLNAQTRVGFAIRQGAGVGTAPVKVTMFRDQSKTLTDRYATTELRFAHAVPEGDDIDVYIDNEFEETFTSGLAFGSDSVYGEISKSQLTDLSVDVTPAASPGVYLARKELDLTQGDKATYFFVGKSYDWNGVKVTDNVQRLATHAKLRLINGASDAFDYYLVEQDENISSLYPEESLDYRESSGWVKYNPGTYDLVVTFDGSDTIVYSDTIELNAGGIYSIITTVNSADPNAADAIYYDDFLTAEAETEAAAE
ncbi:DUF4397 domain-containing protein [Microbulbifer bruguierae]|uniref:DUF4397 domain-containing protein n=1 Tax=Microbulbifer bruguierae TaxID=3029061 RepID=A0ABY8NCC4_9GAMM|nr:DUF4397 domain-containing protein [Microbulbifer bruguierae]WGL16576.1 DUF4397 domain-containing protein [Microbulbifer bruguierae]